MLSINIPVFNVEVVSLVSQLVAQAQQLSLNFEIRVYDDGSDEPCKIVNRQLKKLPNVVYVECEQNMGRATIRNKMGMDSAFKYLLFIDADSKLVRNDYLANYLKHAKPNCVLCGGTSYSAKIPRNPEKHLRWIYGTQREAVSAENRSRKKGFIITSNNFLIENSVFEKVHFRENLKQYGHEDTLLGYDLFRSGISIMHIDNVVEHTGLENAEVFLAKTRMALGNLHYIAQELLPAENDFAEQVNFLNQFKKITRWMPGLLLRTFHRLFRHALERHLKGSSPKLFWFDVYKIGEYALLCKK